MEAEATVPVERQPGLGKTFWSLWAGQTISQFGSLATGLSIVVWLQDLGAKPGVIGSYFSFASLVIVAAGIIAGPLSDRASRRTLIIATDIAALLAVGALSVVAASNVGLPGALFAAFLVRGVIVASFSLRFPSIMTQISVSVPQDSLKKAQSIYGTARQLAGMIGEASGGTLYAFLGKQLVFVIDCVTYAISIGCTTFGWRERSSPPVAKTRRTVGSTVTVLLHDLRQGLDYVRHTPGLSMLVFCMVLLNVFFAPLTVWLPFLVREQLAGSVKALGWAQAALGCGMLSGSLLAGFGRFRAPVSRQIAICLLVLASAFGATSLAAVPWQVAMAMSALGLAVGFFNVVVTSTIQTKTPVELRGRVFALTMILGQVANPLAQGAVGILAQKLQGNFALIPLITGFGTLMVVLCVASRRVLRNYLD